VRLRIVHWADYQHYKDRCPPWVRLHWSLLTSRTWVTTSDASRVLAVASMLLASRDKAGDGSFDGDSEYVRRVCYLNAPADWTELVEAGFVETLADASTLLADARTEQSRADTEQSRSAGARGEGENGADIPDAFASLTDRDAILRWFHTVQKADPSPAYLAAWRGAVADLADRHADAAAIAAALKWYSHADGKRRPAIPPARFLNADWFLVLVAKCAEAGRRDVMQE